MLSEPVLIDTGPLIALYKANDPWHEKCSAQVQLLPLGKTYTCWPVITEAAYLLRNYPRQRNLLLEAVEAGEFSLLPLGTSDLPAIKAIFSQYHDQQVDLADAALVHLANHKGIDTVFTLDRRHFGVYRLANGNPFRLLPES